MSATTPPTEAALSAAPLKTLVVATRSWKLPIIFAVFSVVSVVLFVVLRRPGDATLTFATKTDFFVLPALTVSSVVVGIVVSILAVLLTIASFVLVARGAKVSRWLSILFALDVFFGFIVWSSVGGSALNVAVLLSGGLALSVPLIFGAMGGVLSERVGVVNVAIEGQLLAGAFTAALVGTMTHSVFLGLIAAMLAGVLVSLLLAVFSIKYLVDQVIVGVVLNLLVAGITNFLYSSVMTANNSTDPNYDPTKLFNLPPTLTPIAIPGLSNIPVIGPVLFNQTLIIYLMYIAVILVFFGLFRTRWGLRVRSVGEHPRAADTVGINVNRTRMWTVLLAGAVAGLGGAYFTIGSVGGFVENITSGAGYIALAAVIVGRWDPVRATLAALLFGFAKALPYALNSPIPSEFMNMLPYLATIFVVAGLIGRSRGPAASGRPYIK